MFSHLLFWDINNVDVCFPVDLLLLVCTKLYALKKGKAHTGVCIML